ncbi:hypothetical protein RND81_07G038200 [Saponaria officinalis]|uniref:Uncharacterized protein n=1 Tax=Saponaria officinalis TaxID=3572 RepID=A0AAW1JMT8_SAPOF
MFLFTVRTRNFACLWPMYQPVCFQLFIHCFLFVHSDSKDASETPNNQCDISGEDSQGSNSTASSALLLHHYDDRLLHSEIISRKSLRRELRRHQRMASEIMCDICQQKMLPGTDVAALLNLKTGKLACSSRNVHGIRYSLRNAFRKGFACFEILRQVRWWDRC